MIYLLCLLLAAEGQGWSHPVTRYNEFLDTIHNPVLTDQQEVFFVDWDERKIYKIGPDGRMLTAFGRKGEGPGEFAYIGDLQFLKASRKLCVIDRNSGRISWLDEAGKFLESTPMPEVYRSQDPVMLDQQQALFVKGADIFHKDAPKNQGADILLAGESGTTRSLLHLPPQRHADPGMVFNKGGSGMIIFDWAPSSMFLLVDAETVLLGSTADIDFQVYNLRTHKVTGRIQDKTIKGVLVNDDLIASATISVTLNGKQYTAKDFEHDESGAVITNRSFVSLSRKVWLHQYLPMAPEHKTYRVYSLDGAFQGALRVSKSETVFGADDAFIWVVRDAEDDESETILEKRPYQLTR